MTANESPPLTESEAKATWPHWRDEVLEALSLAKYKAVRDCNFELASHWRDVMQEFKRAVPVQHADASPPPAPPPGQQGSELPTDLHQAIMNIQVKPGALVNFDSDEERAYRDGHRDARHYAAELALAYRPPAAAPSASEVDRLKLEVQMLRDTHPDVSTKGDAMAAVENYTRAHIELEQSAAAMRATITEVIADIDSHYSEVELATGETLIGSWREKLASVRRTANET